jgi:hypothetical protein
MSRGLRLVVAALALLAVAGPAGAQAQKKQPTYVTPPPPMRGPEPAPTPATPKRPATPAAPDDQEQPASPALRQALPPRADTTARMGGLAPEQAGGAQCRSACAQTYYFCLANQEGDSCQTSWTQCLVACPANSSSF